MSGGKLFLRMYSAVRDDFVKWLGGWDVGAEGKHPCQVCLVVGCEIC